MRKELFSIHISEFSEGLYYVRLLSVLTNKWFSLTGLSLKWWAAILTVTFLSGPLQCADRRLPVVLKSSIVFLSLWHNGLLQTFDDMITKTVATGWLTSHLFLTRMLSLQKLFIFPNAKFVHFATHLIRKIITAEFPGEFAEITSISNTNKMESRTPFGFRFHNITAVQASSIISVRFLFSDCLLSPVILKNMIPVLGHDIFWKIFLVMYCDARFSNAYGSVKRKSQCRSSIFFANAILGNAAHFSKISRILKHCMASIALL